MPVVSVTVNGYGTAWAADRVRIARYNIYGSCRAGGSMDVFRCCVLLSSSVCGSSLGTKLCAGSNV